MIIRVAYSRSDRHPRSHMPRPRRPVISPRKRPVQARSAQLVADILQAAIRVLEREGAQRFTTIRVAETAGVSVGSLYQYFPNKQAILYRLQLDEWEKTSATVEALLGDAKQPPALRLRATMRAFFLSECEEAPLRVALDAATPNYHEAPEAQAVRERGSLVVEEFVKAAAPRASRAQRAFAVELLFMTMSAVGKHVSERRPTPAETVRWADAVAAMLTTHLAGLAPARRARAARGGTRSQGGASEI
jgi:AcrR family transcriptional regulator